MIVRRSLRVTRLHAPAILRTVIAGRLLPTALMRKRKLYSGGCELAGRALAKCPPRRDPFLPSSIERHRPRAEPANERCLTGLRAAAKSVLFFTDKILAIDAIAAAEGCCRWR